MVNGVDYGKPHNATRQKLLRHFVAMLMMVYNIS